MSKSNALNILNAIQRAFAGRSRPATLTDSHELTLMELAELESFSRLNWDQVTCADWEKYFDVVNWFSPDAFCYYLPGICGATIAENEPNLIVVSSILSMLDRSPKPEWWDDYFIARWTHLTEQECRAIQEWILWLSAFDAFSYSDDSLTRALQTLDLLIDNKRIG
jgi:hypothetical protein